MRIRVLSCAEREFVEAVERYNEERPGLGYELAEEIRNAFDRIRAYPQAWPVFSARSRRAFVSRFPYGILYQVRPDCVLVLAIMHLKRDPQVWRQRARG